MEAVAARRAGNPTRAGSLAVRALGLWRGRAFGDLAYDVALRDEAERLEDLRLAATEERFRAELALGRHDAVVSEVVAHAEASPLREPAQELAMLALYRCGRQSDALAHYTLAHGGSTSSGSSRGAPCARCNSRSSDTIRRSRSRRPGATPSRSPSRPRRSSAASAR